MKTYIAPVLALLCVLGLVGCRSSQTYTIKITIPAGSTEAVAYADEEISPLGKEFTIFPGEGLGDAEIVLKTIEVNEENVYDEPVYLTPGVPIKMNAGKETWFKIGVPIQNESDSDKVVSVAVKGVDVRIE